MVGLESNAICSRWFVSSETLMVRVVVKRAAFSVFLSDFVRALAFQLVWNFCLTPSDLLSVGVLELKIVSYEKFSNERL